METQTINQPAPMSKEAATALLNPEPLDSVTKFNTRMPKRGETVIFFPNPDDAVAKSNSQETCAAIVTTAWSSLCANLKIIPDHGPMQDRASVSHYTANPAGYHFKFMDEVYPEPANLRDTVFK